MAEPHTSLINNLINNPQCPFVYTGGSPTKNGSNGTSTVAIYTNHQHTEAKRNLGKLHDTKLFEILQAISYDRQWAVGGTNTDFVENQAATRRCTSPITAPEHLDSKTLDNLHDILETRDNIKMNIQWAPRRTGVIGNEKADMCARSAAELPGRSGNYLTPEVKARRVNGGILKDRFNGRGVN